MSGKAIFVLCAQALLVQSVLSQCTTLAAVDASGIAAPFGWAGPALAYDGLAAPALALAAPAIAAPFARDCFTTPFAYDGLVAPFAYDGLAALDGLGWASRAFAADRLYSPIMDFTPTSGGGLTVTSASAIPPTGISVISENAYEGILAVAGEVPFVGTTGMEGVLPTAGAGAVNHACGTGINAMVSETAAFGPVAFAPTLAPLAAIAPAAAIAPIAAIAPAAAIAPGCGCGSGIIY